MYLMASDINRFRPIRFALMEIDIYRFRLPCNKYLTAISEAII